jgi:hypothetical protein
MLVNIAFNIAVPVMLLKKGNDWLPALQIWQVLVLALAFPVTYFLYDLVRRKKYNFISILGFLSVLLTGGIGLLQLDPFWIAVKEAAVPGTIGLILILSLKTGSPLIQKLLYNREIIDVDTVDQRLEKNGKQSEFKKLLARCTLLLGATFLASALINYLLARFIVRTNPAESGVLFNQELGSLALWSWPVIVIPCTAMMMFAFWRLLKGLNSLTGLEIDDIFKVGK